MGWSRCKKHNLPDALPGKTGQRASPSLRVGLTRCLFYLPERVTWSRVFIFKNSSCATPLFLQAHVVQNMQAQDLCPFAKNTTASEFCKCI